MKKIINEEEIEKIVQDIFKDYEGGKNIDSVDIYNVPDKQEVQDLVDDLFKIIFPGYFRDRVYKIYNPNYSYAVNIEDTFYHLNKQVFLALDFCTKRGTMTEKDREEEGGSGKEQRRNGEEAG